MFIMGCMAGFMFGYAMAWATATAWVAGIAYELAKDFGIEVNPEQIQELINTYFRLKDGGWNLQ